MGRFSDLLSLSLPFFHLYKEDYEKYEAAIARRTTLTSMLVDDTPIRAKQRYWLSCLNLCRFKSTPLKRLCFRGALIYTPLLYLFLISFTFYSKLSFSTFFCDTIWQIFHNFESTINFKTIHLNALTLTKIDNIKIQWYNNNEWVCLQYALAWFFLFFEF